jgi:hypothetical protein
VYSKYEHSVLTHVGGPLLAPSSADDDHDGARMDGPPDKISRNVSFWQDDPRTPQVPILKVEYAGIVIAQLDGMATPVSIQDVQ